MQLIMYKEHSYTHIQTCRTNNRSANHYVYDYITRIYMYIYMSDINSDQSTGYCPGLLADLFLIRRSISGPGTIPC